jgi:hypothetical protein
MSLSKCEVRKLSANIRTSAVVVVRYILLYRTSHYHSGHGRGAETISAPRSALCTLTQPGSVQRRSSAIHLNGGEGFCNFGLASQRFTWYAQACCHFVATMTRSDRTNQSRKRSRNRRQCPRRCYETRSRRMVLSK